MSADANQFSDEDLAAIADAVQRKDRIFLDQVNARCGVPLIMREFYLTSKPGNEGKKSATKAATDLHLARAKARYRRLRANGVSTDEAKKTMTDEFKLGEATAIDLLRGSKPDADRILQANPNP